MSRELQQAGMDWDSYLSMAGIEDKAAHDADQRKNIEQAVRTQFILDAIADEREVTVDNEDLSAQIMAQAQRSRMSPEQYAQQLQQGGNIAEFVADVRRTKTLAQLLEQTTITDASGKAVDLEALRPKTVPAPSADSEDAPAEDAAADAPEVEDAPTEDAPEVEDAAATEEAPAAVVTEAEAAVDEDVAKG
jgi:trigger factor